MRLGVPMVLAGVPSGTALAESGGEHFGADGSRNAAGVRCSAKAGELTFLKAWS
jgi:hypothetical protein